MRRQKRHAGPADQRACDIVVTTIWEPAWLKGYLRNLRAHGRAETTTLRIICDRKTPASVSAAAEDARRAGFRIDCPSLEDQEAYLRALGAPVDFVPWNSDNRRNIGFLRAMESGSGLIISIDDDNYCEPGTDFVGAHEAAGRPARDSRDAVAAATPWFNVCSRLRGAESTYPRGLPYAARLPQSGRTTPLPRALGERTVAVNAGLWLDDPDVDAITRLALAPRARSAKPRAVILGPRNWSPINTQNTALIPSAMPAYYYVRMGHPLQGMKIDRFGDILSGYFLQKCVKHLGHVVRFGTPVARHRRSKHNLFVDLYHELAGIVLVEELLPWLREVRIEGATYAEAYRSLADALEHQAPAFKGFVWDQGGREFLVDTAARMRTWLALVERFQ